MCLSDVGHVIAVDGTRRSVTVDLGGRNLEVSTVALGLDGPPVEVGTWLVVHTGLAVERLDARDARRILDARAEVVTATHDLATRHGRTGVARPEERP